VARFPEALLDDEIVVNKLDKDLAPPEGRARDRRRIECPHIGSQASGRPEPAEL
jgi:hypothetical protein